jgi:uncharacterized membrane protein
MCEGVVDVRDMQTDPFIMKLKYTKLQIGLELTALLLVVSFILFVSVQWDQLPQRIPGHFNAMGEVDRWGNKREFLMLPIIGALLYLFMTVISFFPQTWNVPVKVTERNKAAVYQCVKSTLILIKIELLAVLFYITAYIANAQALPIAFLPVMLTIVVGTTLFSIIWMYRAGKKL